MQMFIFLSRIFFSFSFCKIIMDLLCRDRLHSTFQHKHITLSSSSHLWSLFGFSFHVCISYQFLYFHVLFPTQSPHVKVKIWNLLLGGWFVLLHLGFCVMHFFFWRWHNFSLLSDWRNLQCFFPDVVCPHPHRFSSFIHQMMGSWLIL